MSRTILEELSVKLSEVPEGESFFILPDMGRLYVRLFPSSFLNGNDGKIYSSLYGKILEHDPDLDVTVFKVSQEG